MLTRVRLSNFRCFARHEIPFRSFSLMVGRNNAGKSSVVEALRIISAVTQRYQALAYKEPPRWLDEVQVGARGVSPSIDDMEISHEGLFYRYGPGPATIDAHFANGASLTAYVGKGLETFAVIKDVKGYAINNKRDAKHVPLPQLSILPPLSPLLRHEKGLAERTIRAAIATRRASAHFRNELAIAEGEVIEHFKSLAQSWPGLQILDLKREGTYPDQELTLMVRDESFVAEIGWMGNGLQIWAQIMWFLARSSRDDTIILDEPDIHLHPDLQRKLVRLVRNRNPQVILTTHSVEMLSEVDPDEVLIIDKNRDKSQFATSLTAVQRLMDKIGTAHNLELARLWGARRFLFVEGDDMRLLRRLQVAISGKAVESIETIPNMPIGGWSNWGYAIGTSLALKNASGQEIKSYCILDRDYYTPSQLAQRKQDAVNRGLQLHIWEQKEIENYFLVPSIVQRAISNRLPQGHRAVSLDEVRDQMTRLADAMRTATEDAFATQFMHEDRRGGVVSANERARAHVAQYWTTLEGKLSLVSGKQLRSALSGWSQSTFGISLSLDALSRSMQAEDVGQEVREVIGAIEKGSNFPTF